MLSFFSAPSGIYVYSSTVAYGGNLSILGTGNLDPSLQTICKQERTFASILDTGCQSVAPLVSTLAVSANNLTSFYSDIPTNSPMRGGPTGTILADDLASFFSLDLHVTLEAGGLGSTNFWTYGDGTGNYASGVTCNDGDDNTSSNTGYVGSPLLSAAGTWNSVQAETCDNAFRILCICYRPSS
ncbi:putative lipoprotein [Leptospira johnsonii]|uniref:Putative lipoprotein n=1 Tax=Leptospira johnsonii TaxID=1917820 RepID=A0A2P2D2K2_9LEPT|nr:putative lipoprotein [Leptospira johnsonii]